MNFDYQGHEGYDVSLWNDDNKTPQQINFNTMRESGAKFVGVKAGQLNYRDPDFEYNWREAKKAGLIRLSYWFCDKDGDPILQARKWWEIIKPDFNPEETHWADYEYGAWDDWRQLKKLMVEFQTLSKLPDEKVGVYTGYPFWIQRRPFSIEERKWFARHPLWEAWYTESHLDVKIPSEWDECLIWQDAVLSEYVGQESIKIDHNKFNGSLEKLYAKLGKPSVVVTPPPPQTTKFPNSIIIDGRVYK